MNKRKIIVLLSISTVLILSASGYLLYWHLGKGKYQASEEVTQNLFNHIKTFGLAYGRDFLSKEANIEWIKNHLDISNQGIPTKTANTTITYVNFSDLTLRSPYNDPNDMESERGTGYQIAQYFDNQGIDLDNAFLHYSKDVKIPVTTSSGTKVALKEDRFYLILYYNNNTYTDITPYAYGDGSYDGGHATGTKKITINQTNNDITYIGNLWKFREINFNISQGATGFDYRLEYWNGQEWHGISNFTDSTNGLQQSGKIVFTPPSDWQENKVGSGLANNDINLYWVRLRTESIGRTPVLESEASENSEYEWVGTSAISGEKFPNDGDFITVPGWNSSNDQNNDGFIDDNEFKNRSNSYASARFKYQARVPSRYFCDRWVTNPKDQTFQNAVADFARKKSIGIEGIFIDNAPEGIPDIFQWDSNFNSQVYLEYSKPSYSEKDRTEIYAVFRKDTAELITHIKNQIQKLIIVNCGFGKTLADSNAYLDLLKLNEIDVADGIFSETNISFWKSYQDTYDYMNKLKNRIDYLKNLNKKVIIHGNGDQNSWPNWAVNLEESQKNELAKRDQLYALAYYYLVSNTNTYFAYQPGNNYANPQSGWFGAIEYNLGTPKGDIYLFDDKNSIYAREYSKALVLLKPMPSETIHDISTEFTLNFNREYRKIDNDGVTKSQPSKTFKIRNYEGIILEKVLQKPTINSSNLSNITTTDSHITISGTAEPNSDVKVTIESEPMFLYSTADKNGYWTVTLNNALPAGNHTVYAISYIDDLTSPQSDILSFSVSETSKGGETKSSESENKLLPTVSESNSVYSPTSKTSNNLSETKENTAKNTTIPKTNTGVNHLIYPTLAIITGLIVIIFGKILF